MFPYMNKFAKIDLCCLIRPATRGYDKSKNFLFAGLFGWDFFGFVFWFDLFFFLLIQFPVVDPQQLQNTNGTNSNQDNCLC